MASAMLVAFGLAVVLAGLGLLGRFVGGNWLAPAALFPMFWALVLVVAAAFHGVLPLHPGGLWVIGSMVATFQAGALLMHYAASGSGAGAAVAPLDEASREALALRLVRVTAVVVALESVGVVALIRFGGATFGIEPSLEGLFRLGYQFSALRYVGVDEVPGRVRLLLYWTYPAALLGGMLAAMARTSLRRLLGVLPLLAAVVGGIPLASRSGIVYSLVMFVAGFWAVQVWRSRGTYSVLRARWMVGVVLLGVGLMAVSITFLWLRLGIWRRLLVEALVLGTMGDFFGSVAAFTTWFATTDGGPPALGVFTFAGPFDFLGFATRLQGVYQMPVDFPGGYSSNIYTVFRGLIEDFGLATAWGVCFLVGVLSTIAYQRCAAGRIRWTVVLSLFYAAALYSHLYSVFTHNSVIVAWVVVAAVWLWPSRIWAGSGAGDRPPRQVPGAA